MMKRPRPPQRSLAAVPRRVPGPGRVPSASTHQPPGRSKQHPPQGTRTSCALRKLFGCSVAHLLGLLPKAPNPYAPRAAPLSPVTLRPPAGRPGSAPSSPQERFPSVNLKRRCPRRPPHLRARAGAAAPSGRAAFSLQRSGRGRRSDKCVTARTRARGPGTGPRAPRGRRTENAREDERSAPEAGRRLQFDAPEGGAPTRRGRERARSRHAAPRIQALAGRAARL